MRHHLADLLEPFSLRAACALTGHLWTQHTCARCGTTRRPTAH